MACVRLKLNDFFSESINKKSFYIVMAGKSMNAYLKCMVGIDGSVAEPIDISAFSMTYYNGIYLPPKDYRACEPLLDEWIENIPNIKNYNQSLNTMIRMQEGGQRHETLDYVQNDHR